MLVYIAWDGDHIGRQVGRAAQADDADGLRQISQRIDLGNLLWRSWVESLGGSLVSMGGDEGRAMVPADHLDELPGIREQYAGKVGSSVSVGVGMKLSEADRALLAAKLQGGDRILFYTEEVDQVLDEAKKRGERTEEQKIADEYLNKAAPAMNAGAYSGATRPSAPSVDKPVATQGDHEQGQVLNDMLEGSAAPAAPERTHAAQDFERQLHEEAWKGEEDDMQASAQKSANLDQIKQQLVQALQVLKAQAPVLEQMKQVAPQAYQAVSGLAQAVIGLAKELSPQAQKAEDSLSYEEMAKALPKGAFKAPPGFTERFDHVRAHVQRADATGAAARFGLNQINPDDYFWPEKPLKLDVNHKDLDLRPPASEEKAQGYAAQLRAGSEPPAVFGIYNPAGFVSVLDGAHRMAAKQAAGQRYVGAYIGLPKQMAGKKHWLERAGAPIRKAEGQDRPAKLVEGVRGVLSDDLLKPEYKGAPGCVAGHCYVASEALYHLLGGKAAGWTAHHIQHEGGPHWYLKHQGGRVVDPTSDQFTTPVPYDRGRAGGFLTSLPSKRAQQVIERMLGDGSVKPKDVAELDKGGLPMPGASAHHHLNLPSGSQVGDKVKVTHQDGKQSWKQVGAGMILGQDPAHHPVSSREPNSR